VDGQGEEAVQRMEEGRAQIIRPDEFGRERQWRVGLCQLTLAPGLRD
jgi:hypothetical protein